MRIAPGRAVDHGVEAMRRIASTPVTDQQKYLLGECVEAYLPVSEVEAARFQVIIEANATGRVSAVNKTRTDRAKDAGIQEGLHQGRLEGMQQGRRAALLELLEARLDAAFGPLSAESLAGLGL
jgi:flagellar biosynthesis/type III secretory pathway protein FliH